MLYYHCINSLEVMRKKKTIEVHVSTGGLVPFFLLTAAST